MKKINLILALLAIVFAFQSNLTAADKQLQIESVRTTEAFKKEYGTKLYNFLVDKVMPRMARFDQKAKVALDKLLADRNGKLKDYLKDFEEDKYMNNFIKEYMKFVKLDDKGNIWTGNIKSKMITSGSYSLKDGIELSSDIRNIRNGDQNLIVPTMQLVGVITADKKNKKKSKLTGRIRFQLGAIIPAMLDDLGKEMTPLEKEDLEALLSTLRAELEVVYKVTQ